MADTFDLNAYFKRRIGGTIPETVPEWGPNVQGDSAKPVPPVEAIPGAGLYKKAHLQEAAKEKIAALNRHQDIVAQEKAAEEQSWVNRRGFDIDTLDGQALNAAASLAEGTARMGSNLVTAIPTTYGLALEANVPDTVKEARAKQVRGEATPEDIALLNAPAGDATLSPVMSKYQAIARVQAQKTGRVETNAQRIARMEEAFKFANDARTQMDVSSIVNRRNQIGLTDDLKEGYQANIGQVKEGWTNNAPTELVAGVASLIGNIGASAWNNKAASIEHILANAPQLAAAATGGGAMAATNISYALDELGKGIEAYKKANDGAFPPADKMQEMQLYAASLVVAETLGDKAILGGGKLLPKGVAGAVGKGIQSTLPTRVAAAGLGAAAGEFGTEAYQTFAEGQIMGKPATAEDLYVGGSIGAIAGGGMAVGMRLPGELASAAIKTGQKVADATGDSLTHLPADQVKTLQENANSTGDVSVFTDPAAATYAPDRAVQALFAHANSADATDDIKDGNLSQAQEIVTGFNSRVDDAVATLETLSKGTPEYAEAVRATNKLRDQAVKAQDTLNAFYKERFAQMDVAAELDAINNPELPVEDSESSEAAATVAPQARIDKLINLSMVVPEKLTPEEAESLASAPGVSTVQASYLRAFSAAKRAENNLMTMGSTSAEIAQGNPVKRMLGIADYRKNITQAVITGSQKEADYQLGLLGNFETDHNQKASLAREAWNTFHGGSYQPNQIQVVKNNDTKQWEIRTSNFLDREAAKANGAVTIHANGKGTPEKFIFNIEEEAAALTTAKTELSAAIALRFGGSNGQNAPQAQAAPVPVQPAAAVPPAPEVPAPAAAVAPSVQPVAPVIAQTATSTLVDAQNTENIDDNAEQAVSETETDNDAAIPALDAVLEKTEPGTTYKKKKLGDFFSQKARKGDNGSARPLAATTDFMSKLFAGEVKVTPYLPEGFKLEEKHRQFLKLFFNQARQWNKTIKADLLDTGMPDYRYNDLMQFFQVTGPDGKPDLPENVKTALSFAATSWIIENGTKGDANTPAEINAILNTDEDNIVSTEQMNLLAYVGTRQQVVLNSMGQRAVQALGLQAYKHVSKDRQPAMIAAMGAYVAKMLLDKEVGVLELKSVSGKDLAAVAVNTADIDQAATHYFLKMKYDGGVLNPLAKTLYDAAIGTNGVLDKLFGAEEGLKEPSFEPIKYSQKTTRNTLMGIPKRLAKIVAKQNAKPYTVREDTWQLATVMSPDAFVAMAGEQAIDGTVHGANELSTKAKNDGLRREYERFMGFVKQMKDIKQPLYFAHNVWKQQRVGIETNVINPQTSKIHRHMLSMASWVSTVKMADLDNFKLRVAEGLGVKADKQGNIKSLGDFDTLFDDGATDEKGRAKAEKLNLAVEEIRKALDGQGFDEAAIVAGVKAGGEKMHSLDALTAMAHYRDAMERGKDSFVVEMMGEVDGVTNGPMLSNLLYGAAESAAQLMELLNRGGFFEQGSPFMNYNLFRGTKGNLDLYERTGLHITNQIKKVLASGTLAKELLGKTAPKSDQAAINRVQGTFNAIYAFTGELAEKDGSVTKSARNLVKTVLTPITFGSTPSNAVNGMSESFIESIYSQIEEMAKEWNPAKQDVLRLKILNNLNYLLQEAGKDTLGNLSVEAMMDKNVLSTEQITGLKNTFKYSMGRVVSTVINTDFKLFLERRASFNKTAQMTFKLYDAAKRVIVAKEIRRLIELEKTAPGTGIAVGQDGVPIHGLSLQQEAAIEKQLQAIQPVIHTMMSKESGQPENGLRIAKNERHISKSKHYFNEVKFANGIPGSKIWSKTKKAYVEQTSLTSSGYEVTETDPGVGMAPMTVHSLDSYISHIAAELGEVLNVHDAHGAGLDTFLQTAQNLNAATWKAVLNYSPTQEVYDSLARTVRGLQELLKDEETAKDIINDIGGEMAAYAGELMEKGIGDIVTGNPVPVEEALMHLLAQAKLNAYEADKIKLAVLANLQSLDQYALEGGHYVVTEADRAEAQAKLDSLSKSMPVADQKAAKAIQLKLREALYGRPKPTEKEEDISLAPVVTTSPWGPIGPSRHAPDADLVAYFQSNPQGTIGEAIKHLQNRFPKSSFEGALLAQLKKSVKLNGKVVYAKPDTPVEMAPNGIVPNASGWYNPASNTIFVLSPVFVTSALTPQMVLHELVHAAVTDAVHSTTPQARALVKDLESILLAANKYANNNMKDGVSLAKMHAAALGSIDELISYGMTDPAFQKDVLNKIRVSTGTANNKLVTGMQKFIGAITKFIMGKGTVAEESGMSALIANVAGLMAANEAGIKAGTTPNNLAMAAPIHTYSTTDILAAIDNGSTSPAFTDYLRSLLSGIVEHLHGPFGSFKEALMKDQAISPLDVWLKAKNTGVAPFASRMAVSPLTSADHVLYVAEQVEATVKAALDSSEATAKTAYKELAKLYEQARTVLKPADFGVNGQAKYDFLFDITKDNGNQSDYLARFAAMGLAHPEVNSLLAAHKISLTKAKPRTFAEQLQSWFEAALEFFAAKITKAVAGETLDARLQSLVTQLVDIEAKGRKQAARISFETILTQPVENAVKAGAEKVKQGVLVVAGSSAVKNSKNVFVRLGGATATLYVNDRVELFMEGMKQVRNDHFASSEGLLMSMVTELKGHKLDFQKLIRMATRQQGERKRLIEQGAAALRRGFGKKPTKAQAAAVSAVFLRTGAHHLLDTYDTKDIEKMLRDEKVLEAEIGKLEQAMAAFGKLQAPVLEQARVLGYFRATGINSSILAHNAHNVAHLTGTAYAKRTVAATANQMTPQVAQLVALYAMAYNDPAHKAEALSLLKAENQRGQENGIEFALKTHRQLEQEALDKLFKGNPTLMQHGYLPEIYNPHTEMAVADALDGKELEDQGYVRKGIVSLDKADPSYGEERHVYVLRNGGLNRRVTGGMSLTDLGMKGSPKHNGNLDINTFGGAQNASDQAHITNEHMRKHIARVRKGGSWKEVSRRNEQHLAPVFNEAGGIANYRYMMNESTKDSLLERNNDFAELMGRIAASTYDKLTTPEQNKVVVQALRDDYLAGIGSRPNDFKEIGPHAKDEESREIWRLLPAQTKKDARAIWGRDGMMVRKDSQHIIFGYRKLGVGTMFDLDPKDRGQLTKGVVGLAEAIWGPQLAKVRAVQIERGWQEVVREIKDIIVVKTGTVLLGNIKSNFTLLLLRGVPLRSIINHHIVAFKGATAYLKDNKRLHEITMMLESGYITGNDELERERKVLEDRIARNPVKELVDAGLMPSIVEDVAAEDDLYSYKSQFTQWMDDKTGILHPKVKELAGTVYMNHDTKLYQGLSRITQLSDFVGRYTLYKHLTERADNKLSKEDAVQQASEDFINYDIPMHPMLQYVDDMGIIPFMKYFLRIQKVLMRIMKENPARVLSTVALGQVLSIGETVLDSSILNKVGNNPVYGGALRYPGTLDELLTISGSMALIK